MVENNGTHTTERGRLLEPLIREQTWADFPALAIETVTYVFHPPCIFLWTRILAVRF
jgi:hypothetical protein